MFFDVFCIRRISYSDCNICSQYTRMATFEVIRSGCASALKIQLQGQAAVFAENDALVSKTQNVEIGASLGNSGGLLGGLLGGAARSFLTNESWSCDLSPSDFLKYFPCTLSYIMYKNGLLRLLSVLYGCISIRLKTL